MIGLERNQNLTISVSDRGAVAEGEIDTGRGKTDVVQNRVQFPRRNHAADFLFNSGENALGLLDPGSGSAAHVQAHLSAADVGEKVIADETDQAYRRSGEHCKYAPRQH